MTAAGNAEGTWAAPMIAMLLLYSCRSVPDSALLQGFDQHKQIFDRLAKMALEDHLLPDSGFGRGKLLFGIQLARY